MGFLLVIAIAIVKLVPVVLGLFIVCKITKWVCKHEEWFGSEPFLGE